jgi:hypothetical protein
MIFFSITAQRDTDTHYQNVNQLVNQLGRLLGMDGNEHFPTQFVIIDPGKLNQSVVSHLAS